MNFLAQLVLIATTATYFAAQGVKIETENGMILLVQPKVIESTDGKFEIRSGYCNTILATGNTNLGDTFTINNNYSITVTFSTTVLQ